MLTDYADKSGDNFIVVGTPVTLRPLIKAGAIGTTSSRITEVSPHTFSVAIPFDQGKIILWPVGTKLEVSLYQPDNSSYLFQAEIIGRDLTGRKCYTVMRPTAISRSPRSAKSAHSLRVIAVTSGKGGVGKTTLTTNLAVALTKLGKKVTVIDTDLGTANVDVVLGLTAQFHMGHVIHGKKSLSEIALEAPGGFRVIPGGSGLQELTQLTEVQFTRVITGFNELEGTADILLLDTGAGISKEVSNFLLAADEVLVVTTPEPHAMTDAYAILKVMHSLGTSAKKSLIINKVDGALEAGIVASRLKRVVSHYLNEDIEFMGGIEEDRAVSRSLKKQCPLLILEPGCSAARNIESIAIKIVGELPPSTAGTLGGFVKKLFSAFQRTEK